MSSVLKSYKFKVEAEGEAYIYEVDAYNINAAILAVGILFGQENPDFDQARSFFSIRRI